MGAAPMSLAPSTSQAIEHFKLVDLRIVELPEGSLSTESAHDKVITSTLKNISLNIVALPNKYLHALYTCVMTELRTRKQCTLNLISEYWVNNDPNDHFLAVFHDISLHSVAPFILLLVL